MQTSRQQTAPSEPLSMPAGARPTHARPTQARPAQLPANPATGDPGALDRLNRHAAIMGRDIVDVAGFLDDVDRQSRDQLGALDTVAQHTGDLLKMNARMLEAAEGIATTGQQTLARVDTSVEDLHRSARHSREVATWVGQMSARMAEVEGTLSGVSHANEQIVDIARQVNILAINAKIEAARAGPSGRGFSVVADAINELSQQTARAAEEIGQSIRALAGLVDRMKDESGQVAGHARSVLDDSERADGALTGIAQDMRRAAEDGERLSDCAGQMARAVEAVEPAVHGISAALRETAQGVHHARDRVNGLIDHSEAVVQSAVELGAVGEDATLIDLVRDRAARIGALFSVAVSRGEISLPALFSQEYQPIPGTDPEQLLAPFTAFTDRVLPPLQEPVLDADPRIVFCAAVDTNGYLPTHNAKFSAPQRNDPVWNAANSRNRRLFADRVGLKAGRSTAPFLLQTYRRDMGGGDYVLMKDVSAPIFVDGRHWGALRLAFRPSG